MQQQQDCMNTPKQVLLENLFYNWKSVSNFLVEQLRFKVSRAKAQLETSIESITDKQAEAKLVQQKQQQMNKLSKSLYQTSMKKKQLQQENDILRKQMRQQRSDIYKQGQLNANDYELMGKQIQQQLYLEQKDKIQSLIDKKLNMTRPNVMY